MPKAAQRGPPAIPSQPQGSRSSRWMCWTRRPPTPESGPHSPPGRSEHPLPASPRPPGGSPTFFIAETASCGSRRRGVQEPRLCAGNMASEDPRPGLPRGAGAPRAPIERQRPGSYRAGSGRRRPRSGVPGSPPGAPRPAPSPPDAACGSGRGRSPVVGVTLSSAGESSMLAPSRRGPHPSRPGPHSHLGKGAGGRQLISSLHGVCGRVLNSPRLITGASDFCLASEGVVGTPGSFCLLIRPRLRC